MESVLAKLGLQNDFIFETSLHPGEISDRLKDLFRPPAGYLRELLRSARTPYTVKTDTEGFTLKREARLFDLWQRYYTVIGKYKTDNNHTLIEVSIYGWNHFMTIYYLVILVFYSIAAFSVFTSLDPVFNTATVLFYIFLFCHFLLLLSYPVLVMRKIVKRHGTLVAEDLKLYLQASDL